MASQALARTLLEDELVLVEVLTPPNAIGVCKVRYLTDTLGRHHAQLAPHNDAARALLEQAARFVVVDARTTVNRTDPTRPKLTGWTLEHVALLRELLMLRVLEIQRHRRRTAKSIDEAHAALRYVNQWLKTERQKLAACNAGLTEAQRRDPVAILAPLKEVAYRLHRQAKEAGLPGLLPHERALLDTVGNFLAHHATVSGPR